VTRRRVELLLIALVLGAPAVLAAIRHASHDASVDLLRAIADVDGKASFRAAASWNGGWPAKRVTLRHDAVSGRTAYWFSGPFHHEFVLCGSSHRMPDPTAWCIDPDALVENYRAHVLETRRFLDRDVRVLRVTPRHAGRPSVEVWVDVASGLPLRASTFRADGSLYRVCRFDRIAFGAEDVEPVDLERSRKFAGTPVPLESPQDAAGFEPLFPDYLPVGFRLVEARVKEWISPQLTLVYSDGVTAFELQQSPRATPAFLESFHERHNPPSWGWGGFGPKGSSSKRGSSGRSGSSSSKTGSRNERESPVAWGPPWGWGRKHRDDGEWDKGGTPMFPHPAAASGESASEEDEGSAGPDEPARLSRWTRGMMAWHWRKERRRLVRSEPDGSTAEFRERGFHNSWELMIEGLDVTLMARSDLDKQEMLKVLRSLRR